MVQKWDYKTINPSESYAGVEVLTKDPQEALNELGDDGWELVESIEESVGKSKYLVFKRPREEIGNEDEDRTKVQSSVENTA